MPHSVYFQHTENDGACLELLTRRESDGKGPCNLPSQCLLQSSSHTCGYPSLLNMAPIIDTSGVSIVVTVQEIPHSNI